MPLTSIEFLAFLLIVSLFYFIFPGKGKRVVLLIASIAFYMLWSIPNTIVLLLTSLVPYFLGLLIDQTRSGEERYSHHKSVFRRKHLLAMGLFLLIGELFVYKYHNFTASQLNHLFDTLLMEVRIPSLPTSIIIPLGISFYIFQSIGYIADVYNGKIKAERNIIVFLLFISFFPKIIQGPIERGDGFLQQLHMIKKRGRFNYDQVSSGLITFIWGMFIKMVIADRIAILVNTVFDQYYIYGTSELAVAAVFYAIQIYCDFAGYSAMAVGSARVFGFELTQNFDCPYCSASTREFWRRWHISLSTWFRDYVYFPLGGSRCGKWRKRLNVLIVMLVSGIWHGAGWNFIAWGLLHGIYQVAGDLLSPVKRSLQARLHVPVTSASHRLGSMLVTFVFIDLAWIFFRAPNIAIALDYLRVMFTRFNPWVFFDGSLLKLGLDQIEMNVLNLSLVLLVIVDLIQYRLKIRIDQMLRGQCLWFRWGVILLLITMVWVLGEYGSSFSSSSFIYQSF